MKYFTIIGNCQIEPIVDILMSTKFKEKYEYIQVKKVFEMEIKDLDYFYEIIPKLSLIISQPLSTENKLSIKCSTKYLIEFLQNYKDIKLLLITNAYFDGYFPEMTYLYDKYGKNITKYDIHYHDKNLFVNISNNLLNENYENYKNYKNGFLRNMIEDDKYYTEKYVKNNYDKTIDNLIKREKDIFGLNISVDICISDFIIENYRIKRLFYTINHPTEILLEEIARRILKKLEMDDNIYINKNYFQNDIFPIYESVKKGLNLEFKTENIYIMKNKKFEIEQAEEVFLNFYENILTKETIKMNFEKLKM